MDRYPQPLKAQASAPNATDSLGNELIFPLILARNESKSTRIVTEITKVVWDFGNCLIGGADQASLRQSISYRALSAAENDQGAPTATVGDEAVIDACDLTFDIVTTGGGFYTSVITHDLSDCGKGLLVPGNKIYWNISTASDLSTKTVGVAVYYRQHLVGLTEFLGILAARQQQP